MGEFPRWSCAVALTCTGRGHRLFKIVAGAVSASGVRRIEALTGEAALDYGRTERALLKDPPPWCAVRREMRKVREQLERAGARWEREIARLKAGSRPVRE